MKTIVKYISLAGLIGLGYYYYKQNVEKLEREKVQINSKRESDRERQKSISSQSLLPREVETKATKSETLNLSGERQHVPLSDNTAQHKAKV